jgi:hypothetical protein
MKFSFFLNKCFSDLSQEAEQNAENLLADHAKHFENLSANQSGKLSQIISCLKENLKTN